MKAAVRKTYCSPNEISVDDVLKPTPKNGEVLIKIHATTVNRTDCANLTAKPFIMRFVLGLFKPRRIILGTDFAGEIVAIGKHVTAFAIGDRVFGFNDTGSSSQAQYTAVPDKLVYKIPEGITYTDTAASMEGAHYAYSTIHKLTIKPGQRVLINGATGAIGSAFLQLVRQYDVHITATCKSKHMTLIKSLGADQVYDYNKDDFTKEKGTYDFVFDAVGKSTFGACKSILCTSGIYNSSELGPFAQNIFYAICTQFSAKKVLFSIPVETSKSMPYIIKLLKKGVFRPLIDRTYDLSNISDAYGYVMTGQKIGNVILNLSKTAEKSSK